jgi:hypothetical protein
VHRTVGAIVIGRREKRHLLRPTGTARGRRLPSQRVNERESERDPYFGRFREYDLRQQRSDQSVPQTRAGFRPNPIDNESVDASLGGHHVQVGPRSHRTNRSGS